MGRHSRIGEIPGYSDRPNPTNIRSCTAVAPLLAKPCGAVVVANDAAGGPIIGVAVYFAREGATGNSGVKTTDAHGKVKFLLKLTNSL